MLSEILLEVLRFLDRRSLEACQLTNRKHRKMIEKFSESLALRTLDSIDIVSVVGYRDY